MRKTVLLSFVTANFLLAADATISIEKLVVEAPSIVENSVQDMAVNSGDTAAMLSSTPGVSINTGGGISSLPAIHGMADDRIKTDIDGMQITSACPNHMNPALSYIDPTKVATIEAVAGITPVSQGGDSIGGSILVRSRDPKFAKDNKSVLTSFDASGFYKSNNHERGVSTNINVASDKLSFSYDGMAEKASDYKDGHGNKVKDTLFEQQNQSAAIAYKMENGVIQLKVGHQKVPYEGFANEYMDMLDNDATYENVSYKGKIGSVQLDANVFKQNTVHYMNKILTERTGNDMPMNTKAEEMGYNIAATVPLLNENVLKIGSDLDKYTLNDWWPHSSNLALTGMNPNTFVNINNGHRDRLGVFAEVFSQWNEKLSTNFGVRTDIVTMDTGSVTGYNTTNNDPVDATAFNALDHSKRDNNYDITASMQYKNSSTNDLELGFARKTRSPNLYERYSWAGGYGSNLTTLASAPIRMDMAMVNWFGDGNGYVGNLNLKPETAYTFSASSSWHDIKNKEWNMKITPYYTFIKDYIDVDYLGKATAGNFANIQLLQFANHDAVIFGADISADTNMWNNSKFGEGKIKGLVNYTRGYRTDASGSGLYHIMPLNTKISLEQLLGTWTNGIDLQSVMSKKTVDNNRNEPETAGYTLVDLRTNYKFSKNINFDFAITNLFDKAYAMPLGGIDIVNHTASQYIPLQGMGRSFNTAMNIKF